MRPSLFSRLATLWAVMLVALTAAPVTPLMAAPTGAAVLLEQADAVEGVAQSVAIAPASQSEHGGIAWPLGLGLMAIGMAALTKDRDTPKRDGKVLPYPVAAARKIYAGSLVVLNAGYAEGGSAAAGLIAVGRANESVDNAGGAAGDRTVLVERGVFRYAQDGTITQADVGKTAYIVDDQTVADNDAAGTRSPAGTIRGVEAGGVWIEI